LPRSDRRAPFVLVIDGRAAGPRTADWCRASPHFPHRHGRLSADRDSCWLCLRRSRRVI